VPSKYITEGKKTKRYELREDEGKDVSSYWITLSGENG